MTGERITLSSASFAGRLKVDSRRSTFERRSVVVPSRPKLVSDIIVSKPTPPKSPQLTPVAIAPKPVEVHHEPSKGVEQVIVAAPAVTPTQKKHSKTNIMFIAMAATLFIFGVGVAIMGLVTNKQVAGQVQHVAQASNATTGDAPPDETKLDAKSSAAYVVGPDQPRFLRISKLGVDARVRKLGVDSHNELQTPNNIYDTGWYDNSAKPGDAGGAILIDGHVHGPTQPGVFYKLKTLVAGDIIQIERGDGKLSSFKVVKLQTYPVDKVDMSAALVSAEPGKLGLNLITCTGSVNTQTQTYNDRLIVFAVAQ